MNNSSAATNSISLSIFDMEKIVTCIEVHHRAMQKANEDDTNWTKITINWLRGAVKIDYRKNLGFWPNQRTPPPSP